jgi:MarR family transcriptional regulator, organic hydroperoxide resistance regulator
MEPFTSFLCFRLGALTRKIHRAYNNLSSKYGITVGQSFVIFDLMANEGSSVKDIAARVQLDSPAITGFIDRLIKEGLVERKEDPSDRRSLQIFLTSKGLQLAEEMLPVARQFNQELKDAIGIKDIEGFEQSLTRLDQIF